MDEIVLKIINTIDNTRITDKSVIVYDIDNTLIDCEGRPISPIIFTYNYALHKNIIPIIITARKNTREIISYTQEQLHNLGIFGYDSIYFMPVDKYDQAWFKYRARQDIHERGYEVVMSIGDMPWDIGQYGGIGFQIINNYFC